MIKRENIKNYIDSLLIFVVSAFFSIVAAGYFVHDFTQIIAASLTLALALTAFAGMAQKKHKPQNNPEVKRVLTQLMFSDEAKNYELIKGALKTKYDVVDKRTFLLVDNCTAVFMFLKNDKLPVSTLADMYGKARSIAKKMIVLTIDGADGACAALIRTLPDPVISIFDGDQVFRLLRWLGSLPQVDIEMKKTKRTVKDFVILALSPPRARSYLFTALVLIFPSLLFSGSLYYVIIAFVCIILGLAAKIDIMKRIKKSKAENL